MKRVELLALTGWIGAVIAPYIFRKLTPKSNWGGEITTLYSTGEDKVGYYILPGLFCPPEDVFKKFFNPEMHDLHLVKYGNKGYDPTLTARAIARHIRGLGYQKARIISISIGDQVLKPLGKCLDDYVQDERIEVVSIDSIPNPQFIKPVFAAILVAMKPLFKGLRLLGGIALEIPFLKKDQGWHSPATVIEQLDSATKWDYDYTDDPIFDCLRAVAKDREVFYDPKDAEDIFADVFNCYEDEPLVYFNTLGELANLRDDFTVVGYRNMFKKLNWKF